MRTSSLLEIESLPPARAARPTADVGFLRRAVKEHRIERADAAVVLADSRVVIAEKALQRRPIEPPLTAAQKLVHADALRVARDRPSLGGAGHLPTAVVDSGQMALAPLDHQLLGRGFNVGDLALAVGQKESEPAGLLGASGL